MLWLVSFASSKRRRRTWTICENYVYLYFTPPVIFSSIFLHAVTFSHVLHPGVLKGQIGLKLKVKTEISLCMAIMQNNHCHPYIHSTTVLCDILVIRRVRRHMPRAVNNIAKAQVFGLAWRPAHTVVDAAASPPSP